MRNLNIFGDTSFAERLKPIYRGRKIDKVIGFYPREAIYFT